jgi:hypothetical protein
MTLTAMAIPGISLLYSKHNCSLPFIIIMSQVHLGRLLVSTAIDVVTLYAHYNTPSYFYNASISEF